MKMQSKLELGMKLAGYVILLSYEMDQKQNWKTFETHREWWKTKRVVSNDGTFVCMCVCVYDCMHVYVEVYVYAGVCLYVHVFACVGACVRTYLHSAFASGWRRFSYRGSAVWIFVVQDINVIDVHNSEYYNTEDKDLL